MSTIRNITSKATVQGVLALMSFTTATYLAVIGDLDGPTYFGLTMLIAGFYFGQRLNGNGKTD